MSERTSSERAAELSGEAPGADELSAAEVVREFGAVLPQRAQMRIKRPGQTFHPDPSSYDPQLAASDPYYVPRGTFGLP